MSKADRRTWMRAGGPSAVEPEPSEVLFVRHEYPSRCTTQTLYDGARERATEEKKVPVLCLPDGQRDGFLVVVHDEDFIYLAAQYLAIIGREERAELDSLVEEARARERSGRLRVAAEEG